MKTKAFSAAALALCMVLTAAAPAPKTLPALKTLKVGDKAPDFELQLVNGGKVSLADLRGQVIVLNFWATWCAPCKAELPLLDSYYSIAEPRGLKVFAITTEDSVPIRQLRKLFAVMRIPAVRRVKGPYDTLGAVPTNYVIDRAGVIRYAKAAAFDLDDLNRELIPLLKEPTPPIP